MVKFTASLKKEKIAHIQSLTFRCIPLDLQGSQACRTCSAACTVGWSLLCLETVAAEHWIEVSWALLHWQTYLIPWGYPQDSWGYCCLPSGYPAPGFNRASNRKFKHPVRSYTEQKTQSFWVRCWLCAISLQMDAVHALTYLTLRRIGHAPHCCNHRQWPRGLVGVLLPGDRVIGKRSITGKKIKTQTWAWCHMKFWLARNRVSRKPAEVHIHPKNENNLGILLAKMLGNLKCLALDFKTCFQPGCRLMAEQWDG